MSGMIKRGYQGSHRYRLYDLETESSIPLTTDEVWAAFIRLELIENGNLPERCRACRFLVEDEVSGD